ncbi:MAG TPA: ABC transporter substrate-binding protein [Aggregatilineaceae bacterium]|nr:ABC transporter substrate-binding protein [Aggregatilineaceae bacterium]
MKHITWTLLSFLVIASLLLAACGDSSKDDNESNGTVEIHLAYLTFNRISEDLGSVESAINAITVPKINVKVKLHPYSIADYTQQINLALQSGEDLDVFHTLGDLPQSVSQNKVMDITNLIDQYAPDAKAIVGDFYKAAMINGKLYGIPTYKGAALAPNLVYRADIMAEIGIDPTTITSVNDLTAVFAKVKEMHPEMVPVTPDSAGDLGLIRSLYGIDFLGDDPVRLNNVGALVGDSMTVVDFFESEEFINTVTLARSWYTEGYVLKDAATTTSNCLEQLTGGKAFSCIASYSGQEAYVQIAAQTGRDIKMVRLGQPYLTTSAVNALTWSVASTSKHPEAALKFMNLIFSDKDVINLIIYGLEGRDYVKVDAEHVRYPDGKDANTVPYTAQLSCGIVGNQFIQYAMEGTNMEDLKLWDYENKNSAFSPAFGFTFDNSSVSNEISAVQNVINEYLPGLGTGSTDPDKELPKFIDKLKDAGMDKIIAAKQKQLDAWASQQ